MKLVTFTHNGRTRIGKVTGDQVLDLSVACPDLPTDMVGLLHAGDAALAQARDAEEQGDALIKLQDVRLEAPVQKPSKFLAIGMNYTDHAEEALKKGIKIPESQVWFNKQVSCVTGPYDPSDMPRVSDQLDYEAELGVVECS
jgi:2-keto-4-pentenoate hydratase/2-oxohepta-3-ene-1,7-dioic acid hydratase in catechol pathway